ncbi:MAG: flagellar hook capping FlgD N-terminal domain-containing protein [Terrisporobacter othiniensis]|uniref:Flagellar biosynthesis protein FlgD n=1 Tax=Terrisporobacter hibernicus TaxID=2813371 RepID=A0AAX2ZHN4_9FIRM|nr:MULTISPECIES: flagellar hook capping FlgD N-terminal domain-containing protein [Terrisporobacter]MDU4860369.1 flagellar hook capping FlgD N-terminal domain-containing protein [Terrisporobacter othiniensis]MDU6993402.1 flagellar hook capping FlgD N-terminal domain-containing protein [Terrisporobacter othiniensis]UEL48556.1 flagellar biosynthesis protein FlgD [Terrisporobacter hibernicus]SFJ36835.1 flagellar basal-body rod modification protein FlgD [Terrisporobacter glycolicus]
MSDIAGINKNSAVTEKGTKVFDAGDNTDKDLFLKLLVAQMTNQDPFNTQDPTQYVTQLAQFNMLEQTMSLNDNMEYLIGMTNGLLVNSAMGSASALIGKDVEVYVPKEDGYDTTKTMSGKVESVHIKDGVVYMNIRDSESGKLVEVEYGALTKVKGNNTNIEEDNKGE